MCCDAGDEDDCASGGLRCWLVAVDEFVPRDHVVCTSLCHEEGPCKVDGKGALDVLLSGCEEGLVFYHARRVDIDINPPKLCFDLLDSGSDLGTRGYVSAVILQFNVVVVSQREKTG